MSTFSKNKPRPPGQLCAIDHAVLDAHREGRTWKGVPGMHSEARFIRTLARAQWRERQIAAKHDPRLPRSR
jgi:hypothetical protein